MTIDPRLEGIHVLVVDGDDDNRFVMERWLRRRGCTVSTVSTGERALRAAASLPDAIVLDVDLPDQSGLDVARILRSDPITRSIPVLMRSAVAVREPDQIDGLESGADVYLTEPISEQMLLSSVSSLLRTRDAHRLDDRGLTMDAMGVFDADLLEGTLTWSPSLWHIHRLDRAHAIAELDDWLALMSPTDRSSVERQLRSVTSVGPLNLDVQVARGDGSTGRLTIRGSVFVGRDGTPSRWSGIVVDTADAERIRSESMVVDRLARQLSMATTVDAVMQHGRDALEGTGSTIVEVPTSVARDGAEVPNEVDDGDGDGEVPVTRVRSGDVELEIVPDDRSRRGEHDRSRRGEPAGHLLAIVRQVAVALDRARRHDAEARTAAHLRAALLPPVPELDGDLDVDVFHASSDRYEQIGGDLHDVIEIDGEIVCVIGDVAGHGLGAATQMATVRSMLRTVVATVGTDPAEVLSAANRLVAIVCGPDAAFVTAGVVAVSTTGDELRYASAGHPAPLLHTSGRALVLPLDPGPPLGVTPTARYRARTGQLAPGDWCAWYTDGVFERRDRSLEAVLSDTLPRLSRSTTAADIARLADAAAGTGHPTDDDRTVLRIRRRTGLR